MHGISVSLFCSALVIFTLAMTYYQCSNSSVIFSKLCSSLLAFSITSSITSSFLICSVNWLALFNLKLVLACSYSAATSSLATYQLEVFLYKLYHVHLDPHLSASCCLTPNVVRWFSVMDTSLSAHPFHSS